MRRLSTWKKACAAIALCMGAVVASPAQTFATLANFNGTDGSYSEGAMVQGADGNLYGTTVNGGDLTCNASYGCGAVFKITSAGKLIGLYSFCAHSFPVCPDGANPYAGLVQGTDGNFYGTTYGGGIGDCQENAIAGCGTIFKITPNGKLTMLYNFCALPNCADGIQPLGTLIQAANGNFYGTTSSGGASPIAAFGYGTIFEITAEGKLTTLHSFDGLDGTGPADLVQAANGDFYGTTGAGGAYGVPGRGGTMFKITPAGKLTTLYSFCAPIRCPDGNAPSGIIQATDGNFYGTTVFGGAEFNSGTVFKITPQGKLTTLYSFCTLPNCTDGAIPYSGLIQATDGNFYGTTYSNGANGLDGTVFEITAGGTLTTLHSFDGFDGAGPAAGLLQASNGNFYGTTTGGGTFKDGTIFSLSVGLGPFVKTLPAAAKVGAQIGILGTKLTGTTSVSLNGISASFTVVSDTFIKATVPAGATTGYVTVTTPTGPLTSNVPFHVIP